jgi:hypothetical protein
MQARHIAVAVAAAAVVTLPAIAQRADGADSVRIHAAALATIRHEFPSGRIVLDRVQVDTTTRLAKPLLSKREHRDPELWVAGLGIEVAQTEYVTPVCSDGILDCRLPENIRVVVALSEPVIRGDTATLIMRFSENTGTRPHGVRTTVEQLTIVRQGRDWRVSARRTRAIA